MNNMYISYIYNTTDEGNFSTDTLFRYIFTNEKQYYMYFGCEITWIQVYNQIPRTNIT